ncbi:MAG TPA: kelch repeat-containing protein [Puia sp.]|nr:kelch repeat-containing protein [Puia sp.]
MRRVNLALITLMILAIFFSCKRTKLSTTYTGGLWVGRASLSGIAAFGAAASFTVNNLAYVGTGLNPLTPSQKLTTLFRYTPAVVPVGLPYGYDSAYGSWTQLQAFPGQPRSNAVGFSIGNTGYIGSGLANDGVTALADFYAYNPGANTWSPIDSIHTESTSYPRFDAAAFSFDTTAYVLTGTDGKYYFNDVWRYSPTANTWIQQSNYPGTPRSAAVSFVYNNQGYLVTGYTPGKLWAINNLCYDFWSFAPRNDKDTSAWIRHLDIYNTNAASFDDGYTDIIRTKGSGFLILGQPTGDKAYITLGSNNGTDIVSTWEYDFYTDLWTARQSFQGAPRAGAIGFTLTTVPATEGVATTRGFVATGFNQDTTAAFADCYEFFPTK